jgi:predicted RNase H-like nuclease (RuvC/YqgF family)
MEKTMKKSLILALALLSFQSAFAQDADRRPRPRGGDDLVMCLKNLENTTRRNVDLQSELSDCRRTTTDSREVEQLRIENRRLQEDVSRLQYDTNRLSDENYRLQNDNRDLRRQLDEIMNGGNPRIVSVFSYAGCTDFTGAVDLKYIRSAEGRNALEAETKAKQAVTAAYTCARTVAIVKTEEIKLNQPAVFCVAGCTDFTGAVDQKYVKSASGRNTIEAQYLSIKAVSAAFTCAREIKVQACQ